VKEILLEQLASNENMLMQERPVSFWTAFGPILQFISIPELQRSKLRNIG